MPNFHAQLCRLISRVCPCLRPRCLLLCLLPGHTCLRPGGIRASHSCRARCHPCYYLRPRPCDRLVCLFLFLDATLSQQLDGHLRQNRLCGTVPHPEQSVSQSPPLPHRYLALARLSHARLHIREPAFAQYVSLLLRMGPLTRQDDGAGSTVAR